LLATGGSEEDTVEGEVYLLFVPAGERRRGLDGSSEINTWTNMPRAIVAR
jgi:hypothetical protein